jgi:hypothetical protein
MGTAFILWGQSGRSVTLNTHFSRAGDGTQWSCTATSLSPVNGVDETNLSLAGISTRRSHVRWWQKRTRGYCSPFRLLQVAKWDFRSSENCQTARGKSVPIVTLTQQAVLSYPVPGITLVWPSDVGVAGVANSWTLVLPFTPTPTPILLPSLLLDRKSSLFLHTRGT